MSILVVFYSLEGNTEFVSAKIAETLNADTVRLVTKKRYPTQGFKKYLIGGKSVVFGEKPKLENSKINFEKYDTVIIATPIWAGSYAPAIKTLLNQYKLANKKIALFACSMSGETAKCFSKIKKAIPDNNFIGEAGFVSPMNTSDESAVKAVKWAKGLSI